MKIKLLTCLNPEQRRALARHFSPALLQAVWLAPAGVVTRALMRLSDGVMLTWGDTIYYAVSDSVTDEGAAWLALVAHELKHVEQFRRLGKWRFLGRYAWQWLRRGYANIDLEQTAYRFQWWVEEEFRKELA